MSEPRWTLFDRPLPEGYREEIRNHLAERPAEEKKSLGSLLTFTLGGVHFALPASVASAIAPTLHIARIPHRSGTVLLGLVAFRGDLLPCCSLENLLGMERSTTTAGRTLIVEEGAGRRWAIPIDAVTGVSNTLTEESDAQPPVAAHWIAAAYRSGNDIIFALDPPTMFRQITLATA